MTDKSFSDNTNRNTVRNPLLSTAVVGLSIEDLTHNAVLLPAAQSSALICSQDTPTMQPATERQPPRTDNTDNSINQSKSDDFDVNEYIARLQGSRYVSAPINATLDTNMNETADLEEINLNETEEQSLTADIAQNFSQLPAVLPQVASAVFSSLSNMMRVRSREHTPAVDYQAQYESFEPQAFESKPVERPPPMTQPPVGSTGGTFRMTSKKKAYAQIPGLSNNSAVHMPPDIQNKETLSYYTPSFSPEQNIPSQQNICQTENKPPLNPSIPQNLPTATSHANRLAPPTSALTSPWVAPSSLNPEASQPLEVSKEISAETSRNQSASIAMFPPNLSAEPVMPPSINALQAQPQTFENLAALPAQNNTQIATNSANQSTIPTLEPRDYIEPAQNPQFPPTGQVYALIQNVQNTNIQNQGLPPIIPPPTMFSNAQRRDSKADIERKILPPSIARRLASQPVIKAPPSLPKFEANIFVPAPVSDERDSVPAPAVYDPPTVAVAESSVPNFGESMLAADVKLERKTNDQIKNTIPIIGATATRLFEASKQDLNQSVTSPVNQPTSKTEQPNPNITPPTFFTPTQPPIQQNINQSVFTSITQPSIPIDNISDPPKPLTEPPKLPTAGNYRMTKKRPQYYSGPIEGIGAISNNSKPVIPPLDHHSLSPPQLFVPTEVKDPTAVPAPLQVSPFDLSRPIESMNPYGDTQAPVFDLSRPAQTSYSVIQNAQIEPTWDLSRQTTDTFEPPKNETTGFGIIGSLKSKLSVLDINKIQSKVTTFFDPAYNDAVKEERNEIYGTQQSQSNLDLFIVPQQYEHSQTYDYQSQAQSYNYPQNQFYSQNNNQGQPQPYYPKPDNMPNQPTPYIPQSHQYSAPGQYSENQYQYQDTAIYQPTVEAQIPVGAKINESSDMIAGISSDYEPEASSIAFQQPEVKSIETAEAKPIDHNLSHGQFYSYQQPTVGVTKDDTRTVKFEELNVIMRSQVENVVQPVPPTAIPMFTNQSDKSFFDQPIVTCEMVSNIPQDLQTQSDKNVDEDGKVELNTQAQSLFDMPDTQSNALNTEVKPTSVNNEPKTECVKAPEKLPIGISPSGFFVKCLEPDMTATSFFDNPKPMIDQKDSNVSLFSQVPPKPLESLLQDKVPLSSLPGEVIESIATSSVIRDIAKELVLERRLSVTDKAETNVGLVPYEPNEIGASKKLDKDGVPLVENAVHVFTENQSFVDNGNEMEYFQRNDAQNYHDHESELKICETCREFNHPEEAETDLTQKLIENITSPIQLSNPVEVPLTEPNDPIEDMNDITNNVCAEITHITEETIEILQVKSAIELLDDDIIDSFDKNLNLAEPTQAPKYGWGNLPELPEHDYTFHTESNAIGFYGNNALFFDDIPKNASDEIKAEIKSALEDSPTNIVTRQLSVPTAPLAEELDDNKSDGTGLDVTSIEQDASKDFPSYEDYVIEPSETDDDKIVYKERDRASDDPVPDIGSFTDRVEKFKQSEVESDVDVSGKFESVTAPVFTVASYFDTGNYAADTHYKKSLTSSQGSLVVSPTNQTKPLVTALPTPQYTNLATLIARNDTSPTQAKEVPELPIQMPLGIPKDLFKVDNTVTQFPDIIKDTKMCGDVEQTPQLTVFGGTRTQKDDGDHGCGINKGGAIGNTKVEKEVKSTKLPDPLDFFASSKTEAAPQANDDFNRLASYFSSPKKTEPTKSFFELSQGQDHLRKTASNPPTQFDNKNIPNLMRDLTSIDNYTPNKDQVVRHVNYFTVHYDNVNFNAVKEKADIALGVSIESKVNMSKQELKVKKAMDDDPEKGSPSKSPKENSSKQMSVTFNFSTEEEKEEGQAMVASDGRVTNEYTPVQHHWFYRVDCEGRSIWKGFSNVDSNALEEAFNSPTLTENTLVPTDGGRFDVNVMGRLRIPVYWVEKPTNVRRCSWFYKGTTDARYVPYTEDVAEKLEEEYRLGVTQGAWHRRLSLPNSEAVILHTPAVMVHVLQTPSADAWSGARQSTMRPRVVRRAHDESEIEDLEPSRVDHLLLLCHGVGSACDMRFRAVEEVVDDFRSTSLQLIQGHYKNAYETGEIGRVEVLPVSWHSTLHAGENGVDRRLARITLDSIPRLRNFTNESVLDILFYTSPVYCQTIIDTVCSEINRIYKLFKDRNPGYAGGISLGGHSLGSVILHDLLCHQTPEKPIHPGSHCTKKNVETAAATGQPNVVYPTLLFAPDALFALGSPIAMFECTRGVESLGEDFALPTCKNFFNIFHPYDPIAYRVEPLINVDLKDVTPFLIPHHKGRKRMHLELKETMARVGADLKAKLFESVKATWSSMWRQPPPSSEQMQMVVEEGIEEMEKDQEKVEKPQDIDQKTLAKMGKLNGGRRIDYVLQEAPFEMLNEYLFAISSHVGYWESEDTMLLILREIYDSMGVKPDCSVPQQTMTVQREDEVIIDQIEKPSTSQS